MSVLQGIEGLKQLDTGNARGLLDTAPSTTTLAVAITTTTQTAITLTNGTYAVNGAYLQLAAEVMLVQSGGGTANVNVQRAMNGTTAATYALGATVNLPGKLIFQLLAIAQAPNLDLIVRKTSGDINYVAVTAAGGNTFPGGGTVVLLIDNGSNGTAHLKFPGMGNVLIVLASGSSSMAGPAGIQGPPGTTATPPGPFAFGTVTGDWVVINA